MKLLELKRTDIYPNPDQPRKNFNEDALDELADSLHQHGLLQPLVVRPDGQGRYQIVAGERRWRAAERAGLDVLPCSVIEGLADEEAMVLSITENVARVDMDEMEEAGAYASLRTMGRSVEEIAKLFGKTQRWIESSLELLNCAEPVRWLVSKKQLSKNAGVYISRLAANSQMDVLRRMNNGEFGDTDALLRHCVVVEKIEAQPNLFEPTEDLLTTTRRQAVKSELDTAWQKLDKVAPALQLFMEMAPEEMAFALNGDLALYMARADTLMTCVNRVRNTLRDAAAIKNVVL